MTSVEGVEPVIRLYSGRDFNFMDPRPYQIDIKDIAHALSLVCRFAGQCCEFYSVAQHSVLVSRLIHDDTPGYQLCGLLHDASEAYLGDVTRPLKRVLDQYRDIEDGVMRAISSRFGISWPMPLSVKNADNKALAVEAERFMHGRWGEFGISEHFPTNKERPLVRDAMSPAAAEHAFLARFEELQG